MGDEAERERYVKVWRRHRSTGPGILSALLLLPLAVS